MTAMVIIMNTHNNNIVKTRSIPSHYRRRFRRTTGVDSVALPASIPSHYRRRFHSIPFHSIPFHSFHSISSASFFRYKRRYCSWPDNPINCLVLIYLFNRISACNLLMQLEMIGRIRKTHQIFSIYLDDIAIHS